MPEDCANIFLPAKYEVTSETRKSPISERTIHRIRAIRDFYAGGKYVHKGDLGGWIESESNLSQVGSCWVDDDAIVEGNARVKGLAYVGECARVWESAKVNHSASVTGHACVRGFARICGESCVEDFSVVFENATVLDYAKVRDHACISGNTRIAQDASVRLRTSICGNSWVGADVCLSFPFYNNLENIFACQTNHIFAITDFIDGDALIFFRDMPGNIFAYTGRSKYSLDRLITVMRKRYGDGYVLKKVIAACDLAKMQIDTAPFASIAPR